MSLKRYSALQIYRRVLSQVRPFWPHLLLLLLLGLIAAPIALLMPVPLKIAVDSVLGTEPLPRFVDVFLPDMWSASTTSLIWVCVAMLLFVTLLQQLQKLAMWWLNEYTSERMALYFRSELFRQAQRLSLAYHDRHGVSDATYRVQYDAPSVQRLTTWGLVPIASSLFLLLGMIVVTANISFSLMLVALAISPILILLTWLYSGRLWTRWQKIKDLESSALSVVQEVLGAIRLVFAFGQEARELKRFVRQSKLGVRERVRVVLTQSSFTLWIGMTIGLGTALVLYIGLRQVIAGSLTLGELLLVMAYLTQLYEPLQQIGQQIASQQDSLASAERAFIFLDEGPVVYERDEALPLARSQGKIEFRNVDFGYSGGNDVLRGVSFTILPGTHVGIVGPTGAGKTTLISLMMRFYEPIAGTILVDDVDIRHYKLADLRNQFSLVLQEPILLSTSIGNNIAYARPEATTEEIVAAAKAANAHGFIESFPDGYDTQVGDRGMQLSGGERQRIALARAFLKDAPFLILDEPTSAVDLKTEVAILDSLEQLDRNRTSITIAHRPETLRHCELVLNLEGGKVSVGAGKLPSSDESLRVGPTQ